MLKGFFNHEINKNNSYSKMDEEYNEEDYENPEDICEIGCETNKEAGLDEVDEVDYDEDFV